MTSIQHSRWLSHPCLWRKSRCSSGWQPCPLIRPCSARPGKPHIAWRCSWDQPIMVGVPRGRNQATAAAWNGLQRTEISGSKLAMARLHFTGTLNRVSPKCKGTSPSTPCGKYPFAYPSLSSFPGNSDIVTPTFINLLLIIPKSHHQTFGAPRNCFRASIYINGPRDNKNSVVVRMVQWWLNIHLHLKPRGVRDLVSINRLNCADCASVLVLCFWSEHPGGTLFYVADIAT